MVMNLKSIRLFQINLDGCSSQLLMKLNANEQSGIFKDFVIAENPGHQNEYVALVACADGRVYYEEFSNQKREEAVLGTFIGIPSEHIPKGQVCMGLSYSANSCILSVSYKNGANIFGKLVFGSHTLSSCFTYRPLQAQNKNGLIVNIERSGEIMTNTHELHVDLNQCLYLTTLRDPIHQSNYSIHSGYLTLIQLTPSSILTQPLIANQNKFGEENKCEGYCFFKQEKLDGVNFVMSIHVDGVVNLFAIQNDGSNIHEIHKIIKSVILPDIKEQKTTKEEEVIDKKNKVDKESAEQNEKSPSLLKTSLYKTIKSELKLSDLSKQPILLVNFMEKYQVLKGESNVRLEINKVRNDILLNNQKNSPLISKSEPLEVSMIFDEFNDQIKIKQVSLTCQNRDFLITGVRIKMQMQQNIGPGIYKIKIFNREIKILNSTSTDLKNIDVSLSNLEIVYAHLQNNLSFTLSSSTAISTALKISSAHDLRLISVEPHGCSVEQFKLKEILEEVGKNLKLSCLPDLKEKEIIEEKPIKEHVKDSQMDIQDYQMRRIEMSSKIEQREIRDFINVLDSLSLGLLFNEQKEIKLEKLRDIAHKLRVPLLNPKIQGEENQYLLAAVKRCLKRVLLAYSRASTEKIILTHPMDYTTFKYMSSVSNFLSLLKSDSCSMDDIFKALQKLLKLAKNRLNLLFMIYALHPSLNNQILDRYLTLLKGDYNPILAFETITCLLKSIIKHYSFLKNKAASKLSSTNIKVNSSMNQQPRIS